MVTSREWTATHPEDADRCADAVVLVRDDGSSLEAELAVAEALRLSRPPLPLAGAMIAAPVVRVVAGHVYRFVAAHRTRISSTLGLRACALPETPS